MPKYLRIIVLAAFIAAFLSVTASADFMVKTTTTMSGIPMMGNFTMQQTYFITGDQLAFAMAMDNPMMGQSGGMHVKYIIRDGGNEMLVINYSDSTYSIFDKKLLDSLTTAVMTEMDKALDSLKTAMTIDKMEMSMTGNKKKVMELEAEELMVDMKMKMNMSMMGPQPMPMTITVTGSQWGTRQFAEHEFYDKAMEEFSSIFMSGGQSGFGGIMKFFEKLGMEKGAVEEMTKFSGLVVLEGDMNISMEMVLPDMEEEEMADMPGMTFNMNMSTAPVEVTKDNIPKSEFEIPKGFEQVEGAANFMGGEFGFPGFGQ